MSDLKRAFERYYLSVSTLELRQSDAYGEAGRLPYNTVLYLDLIAFNPGCTVTQLAEVLGVTKATVTVTVNRLVDKGMVVRERSPDDGRVRHLRLSEGMRRAYGESEGVMAWLSTELESRYPRRDIERFCRMLDDASDIMDSWRPDAQTAQDNTGQ